LDAPKKIPSLKRIVAGKRHACSLSGTGVQCWGSNAYGQLDIPPGLGVPVWIEAENTETCALKKDEKVVCWGAHAMTRHATPRPFLLPRFDNEYYGVEPGYIARLVFDRFANCYLYPKKIECGNQVLDTNVFVRDLNGFSDLAIKYLDTVFDGFTPLLYPEKKTFVLNIREKIETREIDYEFGALTTYVFLKNNGSNAIVDKASEWISPLAQALAHQSILRIEKSDTHVRSGFFVLSMALNACRTSVGLSRQRGIDSALLAISSGLSSSNFSQNSVKKVLSNLSPNLINELIESTRLKPFGKLVLLIKKWLEQ